MAEQYKKHTHREHILELPDTYIGSTELQDETRWIYDPTSKKMIHKTLKFNPGFYKIFDEVLVNARDAMVRSQTEPGRNTIKHIDVCASTVNGRFVLSVENDGDGIPLEMHPTEKVFVPEMIFGHLLTSGNYNKEEEKIVGGKNGYGAKLANIFSSRFTVTVRSPKHGQHYLQTWENNMSVCKSAITKKDKSLKGFVRIEFTPDLARFTGGCIRRGNYCRHDVCSADACSRNCRHGWKGGEGYVQWRSS